MLTKKGCHQTPDVPEGISPGCFRRRKCPAGSAPHVASPMGRPLIHHGTQNGIRYRCSGNLIPSLKCLLLPEYNQGRFARDYTTAQDIHKTRHTATENTQGCIYAGTEIDTKQFRGEQEKQALLHKSLSLPWYNCLHIRRIFQIKLMSIYC